MQIETLPKELQEKVKQYAALGILKDQEAAKLRAAEVDIEKQAERWLSEKNSPKTRTAYRLHITAWFSFCSRAGLPTPILAPVDTAREWIHHLREQEQLAPASINLAISTASSFYSFLSIDGHVSKNPFHSLKRPRMKYKHADRPGLLNRDQVEKLLSHSGGFTTGFRAAAILGLKVSEIPTLKTAQGRWSVTGKENKKRGGPLEALAEWGITPEEIGYLKNIDQGALERFHPGSAGVIIYRAAKKTGISATTHSFRHYRAGLVYGHTRDIRAVKRLLGHASMGVTDRYLQQTIEDYQ